MPYPLDDTIVAVASPSGGAARGILRASGPNVIGCVERVFRADDNCDLATITRPAAVPGSLLWAEHASPLPCDLYLWPGPRSYTRQPMAEIHTFGSPPLLEAAVGALCRSGGRLAEPGEFTLRAFLAGRLDLTQAEAVLGAVDAVDSEQFDAALAQLAGGLADPLHRLRDELVELLAHLEAGLDFADEDLPFITRRQLDEQLAAASETADRLARQMASRREAADLARVVLVGWPNTGKSSLFNALAGHVGALVSHHPGTTRDYLTHELELDGARCLLIDTAGVEPVPAGADLDLRHAAQAASRRQSRAAHLNVLCIDSTRPLNRWEREQLAADAAGRLVVLTKIDLVQKGDRSNSPERPAGRLEPIPKPLTPGPSPRKRGEGRTFWNRHLTQIGPVPFLVATSSLTGEGIGVLRERLRDAVLTAGASGGGVVAGTAVRCGESLRLAADSLSRARRLVHDNLGEELVAAEIRVALEELGKVVGAVYTDEILDRVFSRFCIGK